MSSNIGIVYATVDGQTLKICNILIEEFKKKGDNVELFNIEDFDKEIGDFDKFIIGSSIRYGVHHEKIITYVNKNSEELNKVNAAFFSVNLVARKPEKNEVDTNPYVIKFLDKITWKPKKAAVFAGMLDYQKYGFFDRKMIQLIMWITKGPTNSSVKIEYTNWDKVRKFAAEISNW